MQSAAIPKVCARDQTEWARERRSVIETEQRDVAVGEHVFLALKAVFPGIARGGDTAEAREVIVGNDFGFDEALFKIGVDDACGLGGFPALLDGPCANLFFARGKIGHQAEEAVGAFDEGGHAGVVDPEILEEGFGFVRWEIDELALDLGADGHVGGVVVGADELGYFLDKRILFGGGEVGFGDVAGEEHGLRGEELEELHQRNFLRGGREGVGGLAAVEVGREFFEERDFDDGFFVAGLCLLLRFVDPLGDSVEVGEDELSGDDLDTWTMASTSRMVARNWLPSPSPLLAPATSPAISTNSMAAGTTTFVFAMVWRT